MKKRIGIVHYGCFALLIAAMNSCPALAATEKTLTLDSQGLKSMRITAGGGELNIEGVESGRPIEVFAEIEGDERDYRLSLKKAGDAAVLVSELDGWGFWWFTQSRINLRVKVPSGLTLDISDGSGDLKMKGVTANTRIDDGSGSIEITKHRGDLRLDDGSGAIEISDVVGNVDIKDGSGSMTIVNIDGHVTIDDGSGSITVDTVKRGLTILDDGSGGLKTRNIEGGFDEGR